MTASGISRDFLQRGERGGTRAGDDFTALMALSGETRPSIIHIRIEGVNAHSQAALLLQLAQVFSHELEEGAILSVLRHVVRRKALPIR